MIVHLIDGTFELFRHFYAVPSASDRAGREVGATVGVLNSVLRLLESGATHVGVATDHVIESFRNELWAGYKTGEGIDPALFSQFHPLEAALRSMGVVVWPMIELEADDGLASAARIAAADPRVTQVMICTPDKDLSQSVVGDRVVQFDRMRRQVRNEEGVVAKFGVPPASIADWLALVGDSADGYPGLPGWGEKSAAAVLAHYRHIEAIPDDPTTWAVTVRGATRLGTTLAAERETALLFRRLATLRDDAELFRDVDELRWTGATPEFQAAATELNAPGLAVWAERLAATRP
ncbi:MAG: 5'-3' exonuclease [Gemmatimonadales bacterium]